MGAHRRRIIYVASAALAMVACGSSQPGVSPGDASGDVTSAPDAGGDVAEAGPAATRPQNPTCHAPPEPVRQGAAGLPASLGATGCFDSRDPTIPLPGLIPYAVNAPLWSDGAEKDRWLALPDGARIHIGDDGDFQLPAGAVLIKTFRLGTRRVETRFFVHHPNDEWSGYTYQWNEGGTDALLLDEGSHRVAVGDREWFFPSRAECDMCHTAGAGNSLGLEVAQLNRTFASGTGPPVNQLETWARFGLFDAPLGDAPARLPAFPGADDGSAPIETRARAYLHANCSNCHRPEIGNSGTTDLRFSTPLAATRTCDQPPLKGTVGFGATVKLIAPGKPDESLLLLRMRALDSRRMPTVASLALDDAGLVLVTSWIASLAGCP